MIGERPEFEKGVTKTVLIFETDRAVSSYLEILLHDCGFVVRGAVGRAEDLPEAITKSAPDIIVICHPEPLDALNIAYGITGEHLPIVVCTEGKVPASESKLRDLGITAVVSRTMTKIGCLVGALSRCGHSA